MEAKFLFFFLYLGCKIFANIFTIYTQRVQNGCNIFTSIHNHLLTLGVYKKKKLTYNLEIIKCELCGEKKQ